MQNLKITFYLSSPVILSRFTTIDSILLKLYFDDKNRNGNIGSRNINIKDVLPELAGFIQVRNNTLSGSIWYIDDTEKVNLHNAIFVKTRNSEHAKKYTGAAFSDNSDGSGPYKLFRFGIETLNVKSLYFYVTGDKGRIEELLRNLSCLGKKGAAGYGMVSGFKIEEIESEKGFTIDGNTPSRPLACKDWTVKTHKVMFYRQFPPYYEKSGKVPCYMPTTALIETADHTYGGGTYGSITDTAYISPTEFVYNAVKGEYPKGEYPSLEGNRTCVCCGKEHDKGAELNAVFNRSSNNDYGYFDKGGNVCEYCAWSGAKDVSAYIGYLLTDGTDYRHIQGKHMPEETAELQKEYRKELFSNLNRQKLPFYIGVKTSKNSQHVVFKSTVAISSAMVPVQMGDDTLIVDVELLMRGIADLKELIKKTGIKKTFWINQEKIEGPVYSLLGKNNTEVNKEMMSDFIKKYDRSIRIILNRVVIE